MKIIVGIDSIKYPMSGIGVYSYHLCKELIKRPELNVLGLSRYSLLSSEELSEHLMSAESASKGAQWATGVPWINKFKNRIKSSVAARAVYHATAKLAAEKHLSGISSEFVYHVPNFVGYGAAENKVVTVHDLSHLDCAEMHPEGRVRFMRDKLKNSISEAKSIIVDTDFTRDRLLASGLVDTRQIDKVRRVYLGVDASFTDAKVRSASSNIHNLLGLRKGAYFLSIGTIEPRKNYEMLVDAYESLPKDLAREFPLVICGGLGWKYQGLISRIARLNLPYKVILPGHVSQHDMLALLAHAKGFIYPSLYEGFGMPVLEAMSAGVPVVTSGIGATLEVSGDAAIHVDPYSKLDIANGMKLIVESSSSAQQCIERGKVRASRFTWKACADRTLDVYRSI